MVIEHWMMGEGVSYGGRGGGYSRLRVNQSGIPPIAGPDSLTWITVFSVWSMGPTFLNIVFDSPYLSWYFLQPQQYFSTSNRSVDDRAVSKVDQKNVKNL